MAVVLVAEDEDQVRVLAEGIIQEIGHQTLSARAVKEATTLLEGDQHVDLLFTDINFIGELRGGIEPCPGSGKVAAQFPGSLHDRR